MNTSFHPVRGLESNILAKEPTDGYVWFATDTKKIYYSNGTNFISMGGNSSIFYGILDTSDTDDSQVEFVFDAESDIEQTGASTSIPQIDDLILNTDGCFYRVTYVEDMDVYANKLTIAGNSGTQPSSAYAIVEYVNPTKLNTSISVLKNQECKISFNVTSKDSAGDITGDGTVIWLINGVQIATGTVHQGLNEVDFSPYISVGSQKLKGKFSLDTGGSNSTTVIKEWNITVVNIYPTWTYDISTINSGDNFIMTWNAIGEASKTSHIVIDDIYEYTTTTESSAQQSKTINRLEAGLTHGAHTIKLYITATVNGVSFTSDSITKELIFADSDNSTPIIIFGDYSTSMNQYDTQKIPVVIYNSSIASLFVNEVEKDSWDDLAGEIRYWSFSPLDSGASLLRVSAGTTERTIQIEVEALEIDNSEVSGWAFKIKANQFASNNALQNWSENGVTLTFSNNFDWVNGGIQIEELDDDDSRAYICVKSGTTMTINYKLFENFYRDKGKNIKIIFKATNCGDYDAQVLNCMNSYGVGLKLNAQNALYSSSSNSVNTQYCEDSYIEYELDIWPSDNDASGKSYKYMVPWIDGVPTGITVYDTDEIAQINSGLTNIVIGSENCDVYIYLIKVYEKHLTDDEHISNFISDAYNANEMISRYKRNDVIDSISGDIDWKKVVINNPNCQVHLYDIPRMTRNKNDKLEIYKYYMYKETDEEPVIYAGSDFGKTTIIKVQGTSSAAFGVAAFNIDTSFKNGLYDADGNELEGYSLDDNAIPVNYFTTKVNVASCEGGNNAINQEWYNNFQPYICQARKKNSKRRDTMEFKPGLLFIRDRNQETNGAANETVGKVGDNVFKDTLGYIDSPYYKLYSVCNFGNSKKNLDVFHDQENEKEICIEVNDNQDEGQWMTMAKGFKAVMSADGNTVIYEDIDLTNEDILDEDGNPNDNYDYWLNSLNDMIFAVRYANGCDDLYNDDKELAPSQDQIVAFFNLVKWMAQNDPSPYDSISHPHGYTGNALAAPVTFDAYTFQSKDWKNDSTVLGGLKIENYKGTYTNDTYEYRMAKMLSECEQHLIMDSFVFHYLFIERHSMLDNVAKNTFYSTEDGIHWNIVKDYDNDTADGNDNSGHLTITYGYEVQDKISEGSDVYAFNAHDSVWLNFISGLEPARKKMYQDLDLKGAWSAADYLEDFTEWQSCIPERCWVEDYYRKYIRPYEVYEDNSFLNRMEGGKKTQQRKQYETYQETYLATKYQTSAITNTSNSIEIRGNGKLGENETGAIPVKMYSDCYVVTQWGQTIVSTRVKRNTVTYVYPQHKSMNDETIYWLAPSTYSYIGDIGVITPKLIRLSGASRLQSFSIGETTEEVPELGAIDFKNNKLLKYLTVKNCTNLGPTTDDNSVTINGQSLDLRELTSLKTLNTEGSVFTSIILPNNAPISELKLNNISALYAENLNQLETLTIKNSSGVDDYSKINKLLITNIDNSEVNSLNDLLLKVLNLTDNNLQYYGFQDINWKITDSSYIDATNHKITILDKLLELNGQYYNSKIKDIADNCDSYKALSGKIIIGADVYNQSDSIEFYNNYVKSDVYPNLDLNFEAEAAKLYDVIIYDGNNSILWQKKAQSGVALNEAFLSSGPNGDFTTKSIIKSSTAAKTYTFNNSWDINGSTVSGELPTLTSITEDLIIKPIFTEAVRQYTVNFYGVDLTEDPQTFVKDYNTKINTFVPTEVLYKDDSELSTLETYSFLGYSTSKTASTAINFSDSYTVKGNLNFYPVFKKVNVRTNVHEDYFDYVLYTNNYVDPGGNSSFNVAANGGYVLKAKKSLKGKITIPMYYNDKPIIKIESPATARFSNLCPNITHIFLEEQDGATHQLREIGESEFQGLTSLKYFDFEKADNLRTVKTSAFFNVAALTNTTLSKNLYNIEKQGFYNSFNLNNVDFIINSSVTEIGLYGFALNDKMINCSLKIGTADEKSNLDLEKSCLQNHNGIYGNSGFDSLNTLSNGGAFAIGQNNNSSKFKYMFFYTDNYTSNDLETEYYPLGSTYRALTLAEFLGLMRDSSQARPTQQPNIEDIIIN